MLASRTPILTFGALVFAGLFGGTAIVETIFNWNGLSQWAVTAMLRHDYPEIQGFVLVVGVITLLVYFGLTLSPASSTRVSARSPGADVLPGASTVRSVNECR